MRDAQPPAGIQPILLATDGSSIAARARVVAVDLCMRAQAPLHIVHVWGVAGTFRVVPHKTHDEFKVQLKHEAEELMRHEAAVAQADGVPAVHTHLVHDNPGSSILVTAHSLDPAIIVMGSRPRGPIRRALFGTVSEHVVREGSHPVLVVHDTSPWPPHRVVIGDDGSEDAHRAAIAGARLARLLGVELVLVHARAGLAGTEGVPAQEWLAERAEVIAAAEGCRVRSEVVVGEPAEALVRAGTDPPSVVVLGARARAGDGAAHASVSSALLRGERTLPILVVPATHRAWSPLAPPPLAEVTR